MTNQEIRQRFLDFFQREGHTVVASAALVPDDPTLLFVNAGMVPFKDVFLGQESRAYARATSSQKCMRVSGKHNDLENVGPSPRHHTFFEMLGNFSFGDYFKAEAIDFGYRFLVDDLGLDPERLVYTVHRDDEEARRIWLEDMGIPPERVLPMGDKTNFWMMADVGPCGPTSEIHWDFGPERCTCGEAGCSVALDNDCGRWLEIWNLVFMQYDQAADGSRAPLPTTGVDTGMGLERICAVAQGVYANYETDLFTPILARVQELLGQDGQQRAAAETGYRVIADHGRAMAFLIADGVLPGNDGRSYVLRLIMRRAMRFGKMIGFEEPFLVPVVERVVETMSEAYPGLRERAGWIAEVVAEEEARFERTLDAGLEILDEVVAGLRARGEDRIPGEEVFRLYDTFGFPPDLTRVVAEEQGLGIDRTGFEAAMEAQRARARAGAGFGVDEAEEHYRRLGLPATDFLGYDATEAEGRVLALRAEGEEAETVREGEAVEVVLDRSPFYAEAGGQVGDRGALRGPEGRVRVDDARRVAGATVLLGEVVEGRLARGEAVTATVDAERRDDVRRNHTATHLLHLALREVVGEHAQQRGSLVAPDRLRFDFAHLKPLDADEIRALEARVNALVRADLPVAAEVMPMDAARQLGATMLFGEKYGDEVRVVTVGGGESRELCGGTHLQRTGEIGAFLIAGESSVGSGLRRIEAWTGRGAEREIRARIDELQALAEALGAQGAEDLPQKVEALLARNRELGRDLESARGKLAAAGARALVEAAADVDGLRVLAARVEAADTEALRGHLDAARAALGEGVIVLGAVMDGAPRLVAAADDASVARGAHAGKLVKALAGRLGGGGGGRPTMAEAGGRDAGALDAALAAASDLVREQLGEQLADGA